MVRSILARAQLNERPILRFYSREAPFAHIVCVPDCLLYQGRLFPEADAVLNPAGGGASLHTDDDYGLIVERFHSGRVLRDCLENRVDDARSGRSMLR